MATAGVVPLIINGQDYYPDKTFDVSSPSTGQIAHKCGSASVADANRAVDVAAEALKTWRKTTPQERRDIFLKAADIMESRRADLMAYMGDETGAAKGWVSFNIDTAIGIIKDVAGRIPTLEGSYPATMNPSRGAIIMREPYGVVLSIAPWYDDAPLANW